MIKICTQCGCTFETDKKRKRLCDDCKAHNLKKHSTEYIYKYRKEKRQAILITKEDNELLEKISTNTKLSKAKIIHVLLENFTETY